MRQHKFSPSERKERLRRTRQERYDYLLSRTDVDTASLFLKVWDTNKGVDSQKRANFLMTEKSERVFANDACNKLTDYGNKVALEYLLSIPQIERLCTFAKFDFEELKAKLSKGFVSAVQKQYFIEERERWFDHLKEIMRDFRISKETLKSFGLDLKDAKSFYYQTIL